MENYDESFSRRCGLLAPGIIKALAGRNIEGYYCPDSASAVAQVLALIPEGSTVSWGGSVTLNEAGVIAEVKKRGIKHIDRDEAPDPAARFEAMRQAFLCDVYLSSFNAISEDGQLVNIDGAGNRVAAMAFGPKTVIAVVGMNKVCKTVEMAEARARTVVAPLNVMRLNLTKTACSATGSCGDCKSPECVCSYTVVTRRNLVPGRLKVVLVGQSLGY